MSELPDKELFRIHREEKATFAKLNVPMEETVSELTIEPGKWYVCRNGQAIARVVGTKNKKWLAGVLLKMGELWRDNGRFFDNEEESGYDLIREATPDEIQKLQRGEGI